MRMNISTSPLHAAGRLHEAISSRMNFVGPAYIHKKFRGRGQRIGKANVGHAQLAS